MHGSLWGHIMRFLSADLVVGVGSHASVDLPPDVREGVDFFEAQHSNIQDVVDAAHRIGLDYYGDSHGGDHDGPEGNRGGLEAERFERLRASAGTGRGLDNEAEDAGGPGGQAERPHDFPHCSICFQDANDGEAWVRFPCRHGMHPACWGEYVQHAMEYHSGPRTCPTCRERLVSRSPFRSPAGVLEGTVEEGAVFRGPPRPAHPRQPAGGPGRDGGDVPADEGVRGARGAHGGGAGGRDDPADDDNRVVVLVLGAPGGFVQALCAQLSARAMQTIVIAVSSAPVGKGGIVDEEWAIANAVRIWGPRGVKLAQTIGPVGRTGEARGPGASIIPVQLVGAVFITTASPPGGGATVLVGFTARRGLVRVTVQEHAYGRLHNRLFDLGRAARARGGSITWTVQRLTPRRDDGLGEVPPPDVSRFSIFYTRAGPGDNEGWLVNELRGIEGCDGHGDGLSVAARGDLRGAVMFTAAQGAVPSAIHKVMMNGPGVGVKAVVTDTGFAIIGTSPATYDGFVEAIGLEAYAGGIAPPTRCEVGDNGYGYPALTCQAPDEGFTSRCLVRDGCSHDPEDVAEAASQATGHTFTARTVRAYDPAAEDYRVMVLVQGQPATTRTIGNIVTGVTPVYVGGRRIDAIPFTHESVEMARTPDDNRAAANVHEAASTARGGCRGGTFSTVARITRAGPDGEEVGTQAAHTFLGPCGRSPWQSRGPGGRTAWYRHPATAATLAAALGGEEGGTSEDEPLNERAARGAVARARPGGEEEQPIDFLWDEHGDGGAAASDAWETRLDPGDAVAFAVEPGGTVKVTGPGEVADITLASRAAVVVVLPWAEGARGGVRNVRTWVKVEVDGIARGAWVSRAPAPVGPTHAAADADLGGADRDAADTGGPAHAPGTDGGLGPPTREPAAGGLNQWIADGLARIGAPSDERSVCDDAETADECRAAAALLIRPWLQGGRGENAIAAFARWIITHVQHHLGRGRGRPTSWQWRLTTIAWVMERCGIHELAGSSRQTALAHIEALGLLAAASRSLPFVGWITGRASLTPGANIPGMRHRNPLIFDSAGGHRGGDAERQLERVVRRIEGRERETEEERAAAGDGGERGTGDVTMGATPAGDERDHVANSPDVDRGGGEEYPPGGPTATETEGGHQDGPGPEDAHGYTGGAGPSGLHDQPYGGTPTGDTRSGELRACLQRDAGPPQGRKRNEPAACSAADAGRAVRRCLDFGPAWGVLGGDGRGGGKGRRVHLLSLFDGVGTAMLAMVELFTVLGCRDRLAGGWFSEIDDRLAVPVARHWAERREAGGPPFERVAGDVWDLLRNRGRTLVDVLAKVEPGAMLVVAGGSPCQQLTLAGLHAGREGLCGSESWNFYVFPLVVHAIKIARPDVVVHVVVENAGSMVAKFKDAIAVALGIPGDGGPPDAHPAQDGERSKGGFAPVIDARRFSPFTRKRIFFSTLPPARDQWAIRGGRPPPWDSGWERRSTGGIGPLKDMPPMMRGRGPLPGMRPSAYQFHPDFLLYSGAMLDIAHYKIIPAITRAMPEQVRDGFRGIMASRGPTNGGLRDRAKERGADVAAQWMHENGAPLGFRAPNAGERARAFGMGRYLADLGLSEKELFDATGNMFDKDALIARIGCAIKRWVGGEELPARDAPSPRQIGVAYETLRRASAVVEATPRPAPVPADMPDLLEEMEGWDLREGARYRGDRDEAAGAARPQAKGRGPHGRGRHAGARGAARAGNDAGGGDGRGAGYDVAAALGITGVRPPVRGVAGGPARVGRGNFCVMDSIAQVLDGAPRAGVDRGAEERAEAATDEVRRLCRIEGAGIVPTVAAWIWAVATRFAPGSPRPILVELGTTGGGSGGSGRPATQVIVFASDGPWDGSVCGVASDGLHTVPLLWRNADGSTTHSLSTGRTSLPGVFCWTTQELDAPARFAVDHLLQPFRGDNRGEGRADDGTWAGASGVGHYAAASDGRWPSGRPLPTGFALPAGGRVTQWIRDAACEDIRRWHETTAHASAAGAAVAGDGHSTVGFIWIDSGYPLQADDVSRLRLGGAWMACETAATPDFVIVAHAGSYLWASVSDAAGARLRSSFPEVGVPAAGGHGEWALAPHIAADTGRRVE